MACGLRERVLGAGSWPERLASWARPVPGEAGPNLAFGPQSWSLCRPLKTRLGSTCLRACATGPAAAGSPCSPTAEVRQGGHPSAGLVRGRAPLVPCDYPVGGAGPSAMPLLACPADDNATIRVTNLSEDTRETDLQELFRPFGSISRIYLAKDKTTGQSKVGQWPWGRGGVLSPSGALSIVPDPHSLPQGFAFISFHRREDAARAIAGVSGFGYDHLILNVEWAK